MSWFFAIVVGAALGAALAVLIAGVVLFLLAFVGAKR